MTLAAGEQIAHYKIQSLIGRGGMGEVYRALDTKLERDVAIKILPSALASDPERLARFDREAKVLAQLNHPGIASIHGVEDRALVMELVPGPTLADRLAQGPIPAVEAEQILLQIAGVLEYAHERGVIHRDLKPANIKIDPDDKVKILDFGLAKALTDPGSSLAGDPTDSPTVTVAMGATVAGTILGTAAYMAPEQARGKKVDRRADIWAFGVVAWEMLTGERLFQGEDTVQVLSKVLEQPLNLDRIPPRFRNLLARCLDRNPKDRLRDIGEARFLLQNFAQNDRDGAVPAPAPAPAPPSRLPYTLSAALLLALAAVSLIHFRETPPEMPRYVYQIAAPENTVVLDLKASPDGRYLAFVGVDPGKGLSGGKLWLRSLETLESRVLLDNVNFSVTGSGGLAWSPDGEALVIGSGTKLLRVARAGGPAVMVGETQGVSSTVWATDGTLLYGGRGGGTFRIPAGGGTATNLYVNTVPAASLPHGKLLLRNTAGISVASTDGAKPVAILPDQSNADFVPPLKGTSTGHVLFVRGGTLMALPFDGDKLVARGNAFPVAQNVGDNGVPGGGFSSSANGVLVYAAGVSNERQLVWVDRSGKRLETATKPFLISQNPTIRLSPDDTKVLIPVRGSGSGDFWIADLTRKTFSRFTFEGSNSAAWSPDGRKILSQRRDGNRYLKAADGSGQEEVLFKNPTCAGCYLYDWSPDGKLIAFNEQGPKDLGPQIWLVPAEGDRKPYPYLQSRFAEYWPQFSPDSRWMAYESTESGAAQVYVQSIPAGKGRWQISTEGGTWPIWRRDGKELFYREGNKMMAVPVSLTATAVIPGKPQALFESNAGTRFQVSRDGQRFLLDFPADGGSTSTTFTVDTNWLAGRGK